MKTDPKVVLAAGRHIAVRLAPYLRSRILSYAVRPAPGLGTIGITKHGIVLVDFAFINGLTPEQCAGLWLHECMHDLLRHSVRCGPARDHTLYNMAGDLAINPAVLDMGAQLPQDEKAGMFPDKFGFPRGLTADAYYELLAKQAKQQSGQCQQCAQGGQGKGQKGQGGDGQDGKDDGSGDGGGGGKDADHSNAGGGSGSCPHHNSAPAAPKTGGGWCGSCAGNAFPDEPADDDPDGRSDAEQERIRREVAAAIQQEGQKSRGKLPAELARWADEQLRPPKVPWQQKLARATRRAMSWRAGGVAHRFDAPGRRQAGMGYGAGRPIFPRVRCPVPRVAIVVDTSGSMGDSDLRAALEESKGVLSAVGAEVDFCSCDARVHGLGVIRRVEEALALTKGGGGTDFRPAFEALSKRHPRPEVVVFATDGCGPAPEAPPLGMAVIWLLIGRYRSKPCEWGEIIEVDTE